MSSQLGEEWQFIEDPIQYVMETNGLLNCEPTGTDRTFETVDEEESEISEERSQEIKNAAPMGPQQWNDTGPAVAEENIQTEPIEIETQDQKIQRNK